MAKCLILNYHFIPICLNFYYEFSEQHNIYDKCVLEYLENTYFLQKYNIA